MNDHLTPIDRLAAEVNTLVAFNHIPLNVVDNEGREPIAVAFEHEALSTLMRRVARCGGMATVFVSGKERIRIVAVVPATSSLHEGEADSMVSEPPAGIASVGAFLDYVETQPGGVTIPAYLPLFPETLVGQPVELEYV